jgi:hypothetical protein
MEERKRSEAPIIAPGVPRPGHLFCGQFLEAQIAYADSLTQREIAVTSLRGEKRIDWASIRF